VTTFEIKYENGATNALMIATGRDLLDALRNAGIRNAEAFNWSRVVTYRELSANEALAERMYAKNPAMFN